MQLIEKEEVFALDLVEFRLPVAGFSEKMKNWIGTVAKKDGANRPNLIFLKDSESRMTSTCFAFSSLIPLYPPEKTVEVGKFSFLSKKKPY